MSTLRVDEFFLEASYLLFKPRIVIIPVKKEATIKPRIKRPVCLFSASVVAVTRSKRSGEVAAGAAV
jgi:hypothetical protein